MFSEKMAEQGGVKGLEEGESELLCYECGADFRSRHYFLRHIRAHKKAEMFGIAMTEEDWEGMADSDDETEQKEEGQEGETAKGEIGSK